MKLVNIKNPILVFIAFLISILLSNCAKLVEVPPPSQRITVDNVYATDQTASAVLTGLYSKMSYPGAFTGSGSISVFSGLSADELELYSGVTDPTYIAFYTNALSANASVTYGSNFWAPIYNYIFDCNAALEGLQKSTSITNNARQQLTGEAKFIRAFLYFYLVNLYGEAPLVLTTDFKQNSQLPNSTIQAVYNQIISDLKDAETLLSEFYLDGSLQPYKDITQAERTRPNKWAASALLARVFLYSGDFVHSEEEASKVIDKSDYYNLEGLNTVFLKNSNEAIWQLQQVTTSNNVEDAEVFILPISGPTNTIQNPVFLSQQLLNSFEIGDQRIGAWIDSVTVEGKTYYYPFKYKSKDASFSEYLMVLRLSELYLIRAEAKFQQNKIEEGKADLNSIRLRAGLDKINLSDKTILLTSTWNESFVELFTEWGHRWLNLKRTGNLDNIMLVQTPIKSESNVSWVSFQALYPISFSDIQKSPNLKQNTGY